MKSETKSKVTFHAGMGLIILAVVVLFFAGLGMVFDIGLFREMRADFVALVALILAFSAHLFIVYFNVEGN